LPGSLSSCRSRARGPRACPHPCGPACLPPHVDVVRGDLTLPETLDNAWLASIFVCFWCGPPRRPTTRSPPWRRIAKHARRMYSRALVQTAHSLPSEEPRAIRVSKDTRVEIERFDRSPQASVDVSGGPNVWLANPDLWASRFRAGAESYSGPLCRRFFHIPPIHYREISSGRGPGLGVRKDTPEERIFDRPSITDSFERYRRSLSVICPDRGASKRSLQHDARQGVSYLSLLLE